VTSSTAPSDRVRTPLMRPPRWRSSAAFATLLCSMVSSQARSR